jgi:hypothetical protein
MHVSKTFFPGNRLFCDQPPVGRKKPRLLAMQGSRESVREYIGRQEEHHRKKSFTEELKEFLVKHGVEYDPKYFG